MAYPKNICIIYNPNSKRPSKQAAMRLQRRLKRILHDAAIDLRPTDYAGHAETLARSFVTKKAEPLVISVSGDGGYHEVINGVMQAQQEGYKAVCAVLPTGNANDHRRALGSKALHRSIRTDNRTSIDLLEVSISHGHSRLTRYGHSYVGIGLTPIVAIELNRQRPSALKELLIIANSLYKFQPFEIKVKNKKMRLDSLVISNISRMAKVVTFENAKPDDGRFEVTVFEHANKLQFLKRITRAIVKGIAPPATATKYTFKTLYAMPMQIDGEIIDLKANATVTVRIVPNGLETYV